ncbi:haloacid dehalogenase [Rhizodiscina lignyota]|uniref:Haloacid dehalogenase n=1 Tax=Rhizodiscina lignyota TaxID=1504668 RepID=A0A9P4M4C2_9PEZI|nr:haloacid dehalogenase [Rhizodiscina lignyota]
MPPKKNLLLCFDAFGTLFTPQPSVPEQYSDVARRHGLTGFSVEELNSTFRKAFKDEAKQHPNYGKSVGMKPPQWWANIISKTFQPFLKPQQTLPSQLIPDLIHRFSSKDGYRIFEDVLPFFTMLRTNKEHLRSLDQHFPPPSIDPELSAQWPWQKTVVGIITNSDDRIPDILSSFGLNIGHRRVGARQGEIAKADIAEDVSFVVISYDAGFEKPDPRIFGAAVGMLEECLAAEAARDGSVASSDGFEKLYVGDEVLKDAVGASKAGWDAILLDREGKFHNDFEKEKEAIITWI